MKTIKILALLAVVFFCIRAFSDNRADLDLWGNVGFVKALPWEEGYKRVNTFSFTEPQHPWINHEWLSQYIFYITYAYFGSPGLTLIKIALGFLLMIVIYAGMRAQKNSSSTNFLWLLLTISTIGYGFSTRPHLFTYVLYALFLLMLKTIPKTNSKILFAFPFLGILWVNLHGAFFIGIALLLFYMLFEILKKFILKDTADRECNLLLLSAVTVLLIAGSLVNPYGIRLWGFILYSAFKARRYLCEWMFFTPAVYLSQHPDFLVMSVLSFFGIWFSRRKKDFTWLGILFVSFTSALLLRRNVPIFAITACFVVPQHIEAVAGKPLDNIFGRVSQRLIAAFLLIFIIISGWYVIKENRTRPFQIEIPQGHFAVNAVSFIKDNEISGNALVFFDWAEYCIWHLYPRCRVFLDGRFCSAYSLKTIDDYFNYLYLDGNWRNALTDYDTDIVLIDTRNPVHREMLSIPSWALVYNDQIAALFLRRDRHSVFFNRWKNSDIKYPDTKKKNFFP